MKSIFLIPKVLQNTCHKICIGAHLALNALTLFPLVNPAKSTKISISFAAHNSINCLSVKFDTSFHSSNFSFKSVVKLSY